MSSKFDDLRLSSRQEFTRNPDSAISNWPEVFSWTQGLILLNWVRRLLKPVAELDKSTQEKFWQGFVPPQIQNLDSDLFSKWPTARIVEYCRVRQSAEKAHTRLVVKACDDRENPKGTNSEVALGDISLHEKEFILREAEKFKAVNLRGLPELIHKAAKQYDVSFFKRLGRRLKSGKCPADVDWKRVKPIESFLVDNWCKDMSRWPALCFFEGKARAEYCALRFGVKCDSRYNDLVRQTVKRLGLLRPKQPKIKKIEIKSDEIRFI